MGFFLCPFVFRGKKKILGKNLLSIQKDNTIQKILDYKEIGKLFCWLYILLVESEDAINAKDYIKKKKKIYEDMLYWQFGQNVCFLVLAVSTFF